MENRGGARRRGAPAVLEHGSLGRRAHHGLRQPRIGPERRGHDAFAFAVERSLRKCPEIRLEAEVAVPERPSLPLRRRKGDVLEHDCALAGERVGRTAEKVFRGDEKREVRRMRRGVRLDLDAYLRRRELLDLYPRRPEYAAVLAGNLRLELPRAARLVCGDGKLIAQKRPLGVGRRREVGVCVPFRAHEPQLDRHWVWRLAAAVPQKRVNHDPLVVAVDAAVGPEERLHAVVREVFWAASVWIRLVDFHRVAESEERAVGAIGACGDDGKRLALRDAHEAAPAVLVGLAFHHLDVGFGIHRHLDAVERRAIHKRSHPDAGRVGSVHADGKPEVGKRDEPVAAGVLL